MQNFLLDTNIIIYTLNGDSTVMRLFKQFSNSTFHISMVSWIETLAGSFYHEKDMDDIVSELNHFQKLHITDQIGKTAARIIQENTKKGRKKRFQDSVIAATAIAYNLTLITNNSRDFCKIKGLRILSPKK